MTMKNVRISTGAELIAAERDRQIDEEGWTSKHDDKHSSGEMADAAAAYLAYRDWHGHEDGDSPPPIWPWEDTWWKPAPDNRIRELVKAGALIAAEIDRLQREEAV